MEKRNEIREISFEFALEIIAYTELLEAQKKYVIAIQLLKSGTSIGANVCKAQKAESKADFIHKRKIADKEAEETQYWLSLCQMAKSYPNPNEIIGNHLTSILKLLNKIISTSKKQLS